VDQSEDREPGEVHRGGEQGEVGSNLEAAPDARSPAPVAATHQVGDLALDDGRVAR
jgi:hypothetical protein